MSTIRNRPSTAIFGPRQRSGPVVVLKRYARVHVSRLWILLCVAAMVACNKTPPAPPPPSTMPAPSETITGNERLGWDQRASDAVELSTFRYAVYVDGTRSELTAATCASASTDGAFACSARLPALSTGAHTIELASFIVDGSVFESARSSALRVTVGI